MFSNHERLKLKINNKEIWRIHKYVEIIQHALKIDNGSEKKSQEK